MEYIIESKFNPNTLKDLYYTNGVLKYTFNNFDIEKIEEERKKLDEKDFQVLINVYLRSLIFDEDYNKFEKTIKYWEKGDIGTLMKGHPFLHELVHQYWYKFLEDENKKKIVKLIFSTNLAKNLYNNPDYFDKYYKTVEKRIECIKMKNFIENIINKKKD